MEPQPNPGPRGLFYGGIVAFVAIIAMGVPDAGRQVIREELVRLYYAVRPPQIPPGSAPTTTGSIPDKPPKATAPKKPSEPDDITRAWQTVNYILGLGWLVDDDERRSEGARKP
jgi:hypothetical protein